MASKVGMQVPLCMNLTSMPCLAVFSTAFSSWREGSSSCQCPWGIHVKLYYMVLLNGSSRGGGGGGSSRQCRSCPRQWFLWFLPLFSLSCNSDTLSTSLYTSFSSWHGYNNHSWLSDVYLRLTGADDAWKKKRHTCPHSMELSLPLWSGGPWDTL